MTRVRSATRVILSLTCRTIAALAVLVTYIGHPRLAAAFESATGTIAFDVLRNGRAMGTHRLDFRREGGQLTVDIAIDLEVRLIVPLYRYTHRSRETWIDDRLVRIDTTTDDDGRKFWVAGRAETSGFAVDAVTGRSMAPLDIRPTSYWRERMLSGGPLFDTQEGKLVAATVVGLPGEVLIIDGRATPARVYDVFGDLKLRLWYDFDGRWLKLGFIARGSEIEYVLRQSNVTAALLDRGR